MFLFLSTFNLLTYILLAPPASNPGCKGGGTIACSVCPAHMQGMAAEDCDGDGLMDSHCVWWDRGTYIKSGFSLSSCGDDCSGQYIEHYETTNSETACQCMTY